MPTEQHLPSVITTTDAARVGREVFGCTRLSPSQLEFAFAIERVVIERLIAENLIRHANIQE
jgi:hypothetical protein